MLDLRLLLLPVVCFYWQMKFLDTNNNFVFICVLIRAEDLNCVFIILQFRRTDNKLFLRDNCLIICDKNESRTKQSTSGTRHEFTISCLWRL